MADAIISRKEALAQGLSRYFTGVPCKRGHICERDRDARCIQCRRQENNRRNTTPGEYRDRHLGRRRAWREANAEQLKAESAAYRAANAEKVRESSRRHYENSREKQLERAKRWRRENPEKRQAYLDRTGREKNREWRTAHSEEQKAYQARWRVENKDRKYAAIHKRRALKKQSTGQHTAADIVAIAKAQGHRCAYCKIALKRAKRNIDHIVPLKLGGSNDRTNIQILCEPCNLSKGSKHPATYARSIGLLL